jgi:hypothetical protein
MKSFRVATFAVMKRFLGITIFVAMTIVAWGQSSGNPFDLKYRPANPKSTTPVTPPARDSIAKTTPAPPKPALVPDGKKTPGDSIAKSSVGIVRDTNRPIDQSNPFELSGDTDTLQTQVLIAIDTQQLSKQKEVIKPLVFKTKASRGFQIFFLLLSLLLLIFIVNVERSFVRDLWRVISNENYSSLHHRNQRNTMRQILLIMGYSIFIIQAGLFIYHSLRIFNYSGTLLDNVWVAIALVMCVYVIRHLGIRYLRWLFNNDKELTLFGFDISIFNTMVGLVLLPINVLLIFGPDGIHKPLVITGIIVIGMAYLIRQLRWLLSAHQLIGNSLFLFFVYLCTVEILPLWAISKLFW